MLRGVLDSQAPPKQYASETIDTYANRLVNATLLEDRRQAILGLRSFAKEYPASVASGGLRGLISSLARDIDDVDTGKIVLETLLTLFNPNENSPEADDDIALWIADQFSQRQDNITILLDLLENQDYYSRLYSLRLLTEICSARPERTQECILSAPLGTARLVAMLDDSRDAVRSAGLYLLNEVLNDMTEWSFELQKIVAFEDAFDRIFNLMKSEGSLIHGGIVVQDCLALLANLLRTNTSNQSLFREPRVLSRLANLFEDEDEDDEGPSDPSAPNENRDKNLWGVLSVLRMFLKEGGIGTSANQTAFANHGILQIVLNLSFTPSMGPPIRAEALKTCADIIRGNSKLQERFANNQVPLVSSSVDEPPPQMNGDSSKDDDARSRSRQRQPVQQETVYVMEALLDVTLTVPKTKLFDVRSAAVECISAYFHDYTPARHHFLRHAINLHYAEAGSDDASSNAISVLLAGPRAYPRNDPYRIWFASLLALRLVFDDPEAKDTLRAVVEGDAESGEEVVTAIQVLTGNVITAYNEDDDERVVVGYLMLLCGWLFEDSASVDDFLSEGSAVQEVVKMASKPSKDRSLSQGLAAVLLGIVYEFSTKDSPIPRRKLQPLLLDNVTRDTYTGRLTTLRSHPGLRDFEVQPQTLASAPGPGMLPLVYFDASFVEFLKDNFSRLLRSLDRNPGLEAPKPHEGVDRDLLDDLRSQMSQKSTELEKAQSEVLALESRLAASQGDQRKATETLQSDVSRLTAEATRIKSINEALQRGHEAEIERLATSHRSEVTNTKSQLERAAQELRTQHARTLQEAETKAAQRASASEGSLRAQIATLEQKHTSQEKAAAQAKQQKETLQATLARDSETIKQRDGQITSLTQRTQVLEESLELATSNVRKMETQLRESESRLKDARSSESKARADAEKRAEDDRKKSDAKESALRKELETERKKSKNSGGKNNSKALEESETARVAAQTELDDLLIVLGDIEEKRTKDKEKIKQLGGETSDDEDSDEEGEEEEDAEEDEDEEDEEASDASEEDTETKADETKATAAEGANQQAAEEEDESKPAENLPTLDDTDAARKKAKDLVNGSKKKPQQVVSRDRMAKGLDASSSGKAKGGKHHTRDSSVD